MSNFVLGVLLTTAPHPTITQPNIAMPPIVSAMPPASSSVLLTDIGTTGRKGEPLQSKIYIDDRIINTYLI